MLKPHALFAILATVTGIGFTFATPPFQSPDEVGHYWRGVSIGEGIVSPRVTARGPSAELPRGVKDLVAATWVDPFSERGAKFSAHRWHDAWHVALQPRNRVLLSFPAFYTPLPSAAMAAAAAAGEAFRLRPFITFYLGRLANLALFIALASGAIAITPVAPWAFFAAASMPMAMFLGGAWSADPATTGVIFLLGAAVLRAATSPRPLTNGGLLGIALLVLAVGLCKGAYGASGLIALGIPASRFGTRRRALGSYVVVLMLISAGVLTSAAIARQNYFPMRSGIAVDPQQQMRCVAADPLRFVRTVGEDLRANGASYLEEMVGRLGWLEVKLPGFVITGELLIFAVAVLFSRRDQPAPSARIPTPLRLLALVALAGCAAAVVLSQYLIWSPVCGEVIEGMQGRYLLPLLPLVVIASAGWLREWRAVRYGVPAMAAVANVVALVAVYVRYY